MRQGRKLLCVVTTLAMLACAAALPAHAARSTSGKAASSSVAKKKAGLRQFTGWITALDKTSITVEKRGKLAKTMVFTKDTGMSTTGDVEKDAHVTVYYRDDGGRAVAHRVVVKPLKTAAAER